MREFQPEIDRLAADAADLLRRVDFLLVRLELRALLSCRRKTLSGASSYRYLPANSLHHSQQPFTATLCGADFFSQGSGNHIEKLSQLCYTETKEKNFLSKCSVFL